MFIRPLDILIALKAISLTPSLRNSDRQVASTLLDHYNRRTGQCDPSLARIASLTGVCSRTVMRSMDRIEAARLFHRVRHGGKSNRNSYEPNWARFRELEAEWNARLRENSRSRMTTEVSPASSQSCHLGGDKPVTQTCPRNLSQETCRSLPRKPEGKGLQRESDSTTLTRAIRPADAARTAAERRWTTALHDAFAGMPVTYPEIIAAIDGAMSDAATDAEMHRHGAGFDHIVKQLKLEGGR